MNITRSSGLKSAISHQNPSKPSTEFQPASPSSLQQVDSFAATQSRDGEAGIALVMATVVAVPAVLGAVGGGTLASVFDAGALGVTAAAIGGGLVGGGLMVGYLTSGD